MKNVATQIILADMQIDKGKLLSKVSSPQLMGAILSDDSARGINP